MKLPKKLSQLLVQEKTLEVPRSGSK